MTKKEMITKCIENQIERGIIKEENKEAQIKARLKNGLFYMTYSEAESWYNAVFNK